MANIYYSTQWANLEEGTIVKVKGDTTAVVGVDAFGNYSDAKSAGGDLVLCDVFASSAWAGQSGNVSVDLEGDSYTLTIGVDAFATLGDAALQVAANQYGGVETYGDESEVADAYIFVSGAWGELPEYTVVATGGTSAWDEAGVEYMIVTTAVVGVNAFGSYSDANEKADSYWAESGLNSTAMSSDVYIDASWISATYTAGNTVTATLVDGTEVTATLGKNAALLDGTSADTINASIRTVAEAGAANGGAVYFVSGSFKSAATTAGYIYTYGAKTVIRNVSLDNYGNSYGFAADLKTNPETYLYSGAKVGTLYVGGKARATAASLYIGDGAYAGTIKPLYEGNLKICDIVIDGGTFGELQIAGANITENANITTHKAAQGTIWLGSSSGGAFSGTSSNINICVENQSKLTAIRTSHRSVNWSEWFKSYNVKIMDVAITVTDSTIGNIGQSGDLSFWCFKGFDITLDSGSITSITVGSGANGNLAVEGGTATVTGGTFVTSFSDAGVVYGDENTETIWSDADLRYLQGTRVINADGSITIKDAIFYNGAAAKGEQWIKGGTATIVGGTQKKFNLSAVGGGTSYAGTLTGIESITVDASAQLNVNAAIGAGVSITIDATDFAFESGESQKLLIGTKKGINTTNIVILENGTESDKYVTALAGDGLYLQGRPYVYSAGWIGCLDGDKVNYGGATFTIGVDAFNNYAVGEAKAALDAKIFVNADKYYSSEWKDMSTGSNVDVILNGETVTLTIGENAFTTLAAAQKAAGGGSFVVYGGTATYGGGSRPCHLTQDGQTLIFDEHTEYGSPYNGGYVTNSYSGKVVITGKSSLTKINGFSCGLRTDKELTVVVSDAYVGALYSGNYTSTDGYSVDETTGKIVWNGTAGHSVTNLMVIDGGTVGTIAMGCDSTGSQIGDVFVTIDNAYVGEINGAVRPVAGNEIFEISGSTIGTIKGSGGTYSHYMDFTFTGGSTYLGSFTNSWNSASGVAITINAGNHASLAVGSSFSNLKSTAVITINVDNFQFDKGETSFTVLSATNGLSKYSFNTTGTSLCDYTLDVTDRAVILKTKDCFFSSAWQGLADGTVVSTPGGTGTIGYDAFLRYDDAVAAAAAKGWGLRSADRYFSWDWSDKQAGDTVTIENASGTFTTTIGDPDITAYTKLADARAMSTAVGTALALVGGTGILKGRYGWGNVPATILSDGTILTAEGSQAGALITFFDAVSKNPDYATSFTVGQDAYLSSIGLTGNIGDTSTVFKSVTIQAIDGGTIGSALLIGYNGIVKGDIHTVVDNGGIIGAISGAISGGTYDGNVEVTIKKGGYVGTFRLQPSSGSITTLAADRHFNVTLDGGTINVMQQDNDGNRKFVKGTGATVNMTVTGNAKSVVNDWSILYFDTLTIDASASLTVTKGLAYTGTITIDATNYVAESSRKQVLSVGWNFTNEYQLVGDTESKYILVKDETALYIVAKTIVYSAAWQGKQAGDIVTVDGNTYTIGYDAFGNYNDACAQATTLERPVEICDRYFSSDWSDKTAGDTVDVDLDGDTISLTIGKTAFATLSAAQGASNPAAAVVIEGGSYSGTDAGSFQLGGYRTILQGGTYSGTIFGGASGGSCNSIDVTANTATIGSLNPNRYVACAGTINFHVSDSVVGSIHTSSYSQDTATTAILIENSRVGALSAGFGGNNGVTTVTAVSSTFTGPVGGGGLNNSSNNAGDFNFNFTDVTMTGKGFIAAVGNDGSNWKESRVTGAITVTVDGTASNFSVFDVRKYVASSISVTIDADALLTATTFNADASQTITIDVTDFLFDESEISHTVISAKNGGLTNYNFVTTGTSLDDYNLTVTDKALILTKKNCFFSEAWQGLENGTIVQTPSGTATIGTDAFFLYADAKAAADAKGWFLQTPDRFYNAEWKGMEAGTEVTVVNASGTFSTTIGDAALPAYNTLNSAMTAAKSANTTLAIVGGSIALSGRNGWNNVLNTIVTNTRITGSANGAIVTMVDGGKSDANYEAAFTVGEGSFLSSLAALGNDAGCTVKGFTYNVVDGGKVGTVYMVGYTGDYVGDLAVNLDGGTIENIYTALTTGKITGTVNINLSNGAKIGQLWLAPQSSSVSTLAAGSSINVTLDGSSMLIRDFDKSHTLVKEAGSSINVAVKGSTSTINFAASSVDTLTVDVGATLVIQDNWNYTGTITIDAGATLVISEDQLGAYKSFVNNGTLRLTNDAFLNVTDGNFVKIGTINGTGSVVINDSDTVKVYTYGNNYYTATQQSKVYFDSSYASNAAFDKVTVSGNSAYVGVNAFAKFGDEQGKLAVNGEAYAIGGTLAGDYSGKLTFANANAMTVTGAITSSTLAFTGTTVAFTAQQNFSATDIYVTCEMPASGLTVTIATGDLGLASDQTLTVNGEAWKIGEIKGLYVLRYADNVLSIADKSAANITVESSPAQDTWTNQNVTVTATFTATQQNQYSFDNANWQEYTAPLSIDGNKMIYFKAKDAATGTQDVQANFEVKNIDKVDPTISDITPSTTNWTNQDVTITANYTDDYSGLAAAMYKIGDGEWQGYQGVITVTENALVTFLATDNAGNEATASYLVSNIDKVKPTISDITPSETGWTKKDVTITATYADDYSGLAQQIYKIGDGEWQSYQGVITVTENALVTLMATDNAGNSTTETYLVSNIDKVKPTITVNATPSTWTNQDVTISVDYVDDLSGLATAMYKIGDGAWKNYQGAFTVSKNAVLYFKATDNVGNEATEEFNVNYIDKIAPTISDITPSTKNWTNQDVTITATYADKGVSGLKESLYKIGDGAWQNYQGVITVTENALVTLMATDNAGNEVTKEYNVTNIDKVAPTIDITPSTTAWTNQDITIAAAYADEGGSLLKESLYKIGDGNWKAYKEVITISENVTVYFKATDNAGNVTLKEYPVTNIDKVNPTISNITPSTKNWTNQDVTITALYADNLSGLAAAMYKIDEGEWQGYQGVITVTENALVTFLATDNAGNSTTETYLVNNIDKVKPTISNITPSTTSWTNQDVTITADYADEGGSLLKESLYKIGDGAWQHYQGVITVTENALVTLKATDNAGNVTTDFYNVTNIDKVNPTISNITPSTKNWTNQDVTITAIYADNLSGLAAAMYKIGDGEWQGYQGVITVTENALVTLKATDNAGNVTTEFYNVTNIDKVDPTITITQTPAEWTNQSVVVSALYTDNLSGVATQEYSFDNQNWFTYTTPHVVDTNNTTIYYRATDNAGNSTTTSFTVTTIDKIAPLIAPGKVTAAKNRQSACVTTEFVDPVDEWGYASGIKDTLYHIDDGDWQYYDAAKGITVYGNGTIYFWTRDNAGNTATDSTVVDIFSGPTVCITVTPANGKNADEWTNSSVTVSASFYANTPGTTIVAKEYSFDGFQWVDYDSSLNINSYSTIYFRVKDSEGKSLTTSREILIDHLAPTISVSEIDGMLVANFADDRSGIATQKYSYDQLEWFDYTQSLAVVRGMTVYFKATDFADNETNVSFTTTQGEYSRFISGVVCETGTDELVEMPSEVIANGGKLVLGDNSTFVTTQLVLNNGGAIDTNAGVCTAEIVNANGGVNTISGIVNGGTLSVAPNTVLNLDIELFESCIRNWNVFRNDGVVNVNCGDNFVTQQDIQAISDNGSLGKVNFYGAVYDVSKLQLAGAFDVTFNALYGTAKNDKLLFKSGADIDFGSNLSWIDLGAGNNSLELQADAQANVRSNIANVTTVKVAAAKRAATALELADVNFVGNAKCTTGNNTSLKADDVRSASTLALTTGKASQTTLGNVLLGAGNDKISIGNNSTLVTKSISLGAGKNNIVIGAGSQVIVKGDLDNVCSLTLGNYASMQIDGNYSGTAIADTLKLGNGASFSAGNLVFGDGNDKVTIGNSATFNAQSLDLGNGKNTLSIGTGSKASILGVVNGVSTLTLGKAAAMNFSGNYVGTAAADTLKLSNSAVFNGGALFFGDGNDKVTVSNDATFNAQSIDFGNGKNTLSLGSRSHSNISGNVLNATTLSLGSSSSMLISGDIYSVGANNSLKLGNGTSFNVNNLVFGDANDVITLGKGSTFAAAAIHLGGGNDKVTLANDQFTAETLDLGWGNDTLDFGSNSYGTIGNLDFGDGKDKLTIGKNCELWLDGSYSGTLAIKVGASSKLHLAGALYDAVTSACAKDIASGKIEVTKWDKLA